jgi:hypothetical protein
MTDAIARVAAWKLGLADIDPRARVSLVSSNGRSRYQAGTTATLLAVSGHNDGYPTNCPGASLSAELPAIRESAARLQGRIPPAPARPRTPTTGPRTPPTGPGTPTATGPGTPTATGPGTPTSSPGTSTPKP